MKSSLRSSGAAIIWRFRLTTSRCVRNGEREERSSADRNDGAHLDLGRRNECGVFGEDVLSVDNVVEARDVTE